MSSHNRLLAVLVCAGMLTVMVPSAVPASEEAEAASMAPVTLIVGMPQTVDNLNPLVGYQNIAYQCYILQFDFLYLFDKDFNAVPRAAESWSHNTDGKVWTFNIRHGMTFHDGVTVTAHDVNWTFNMIMSDPSAGSLYVDLLRNVTDIRAIDNYTLQITSNAPKANMLGLMIPILPMHLWSKIPANKLMSVDLWDTQYFPNGPVGSGPFKLVEYVTDTTVTFTKYAGYYGGTVHFDELIYKIYVNPQVMLTDLTAGRIDVACMVPKESWVTTLEQPNIEGQVVPELVLHELGFNVCPKDLRVGGASTNYETLNRSVRKAVAMAINKTELVEKCLFGLGEPGDVLVAPASKMWHYNLTPAEEIKFDLAAASALLNASGYTDIDSDGIRENETNKAELSFTYLYATEYPEDQTAAVRISRWLADIGIEATPVGELESQLYVDWIGMKYDMFMWNWGEDVDPTFILSVMTTDQIPSSHNDWSAWSDSFYSNPVYDQLFVEQMTTIDIAQRQQKVFEMQRILYRDCPYVILHYPDGLYAYRTDKFTNFPEMVTDAVSPMSGTSGGPWFFFEILPIGANLPPRDVSAGQNTQVALNETRSFTGEAYDPEGDPLTWTWRFAEPNGTTNNLTGRTVLYTFLNEGSVTITLEVSDGINDPEMDQMTATVVYIPNKGYLVGRVNDTAGNLLTAAAVSVPGTSTVTNETGHYNMTLAIGTYTVTASKEGFGAASDTAIIAKDQVTELNFSLINTSGTLSGHVYDSDTGDPLDNVTVSARMGDVNRILVTGDDGAYEMMMLPVGEYTVTASKSGYETNTTTAVIVAGEVTTLDIELSVTSAGGGGGLSTAALVAIGVVIAVVVIAAVALMLMKRKKGAAPSEAPPKPPTA